MMTGYISLIRLTTYFHWIRLYILSNFSWINSLASSPPTMTMSPLIAHQSHSLTSCWGCQEFSFTTWLGGRLAYHKRHNLLPEMSLNWEEIEAGCCYHFCNTFLAIQRQIIQFCNHATALLVHTQNQNISSNACYGL